MKFTMFHNNVLKRLSILVLVSLMSFTAHPTFAGPDDSAKSKPHAWLGVYVAPLSAALRAQLQIGKSVGVLIEKVVPESPASEAELKPYDVILALGDQKLFNRDQLLSLLVTTEPNTEVDLAIVRAGETITVPVTLGSRDPKAKMSSKWDDLEIDQDVKVMIEKFTQHPEVQSALSEAEEEIEEILQSLHESLPTEADINAHISAALKALSERGTVVHEMEFLEENEFTEIDEAQRERKIMRRSRILSDATDINYSDRYGEIQVKTTADSQTVRLADKDGTVIYEGNLDETAIEALEERDQKRLRNLLRMHKIEISDS